jgi:hypothetical protein
MIIMNKYLGRFLIAFVFLSKAAFAQNKYEKEIKTSFETYLASVEKRDYEGSVEYLIPEFFDVIPKEQMIDMMKQVFENPTMEFQIKDSKVLDVGKLQVLNKKYYSMMHYSAVMFMKFSFDTEGQDEASKLETQKQMKAAFDEGFGAGNVKYHAETDTYEIYAKKQVCASSVNGVDNWKFIVFEKDLMPIMVKFLPKEILDQAEF